MRSWRVYCSDLRSGEVRLSPEESHHIVDSLRGKVGDELTLFDGAGREGSGQIREIRRGEVRVCVEAVGERPFELRYRVTLAVAMSKAHRQGYLVEKCTELGVAAIWPVIAERSVARPSDFAVTKWHRRAIEAAKQSGRAWVSKIEEPQRLKDVLGRVGEFEVAVIADIESKSRPLIDVLKVASIDARVLVCVGPEGGWTDAEREMARKAGIGSVILAPTVLRTETAAVAVCAAAAMVSMEAEE